MVEPNLSSSVSIRNPTNADSAALASLATQLGYKCSSEKIVKRLASFGRENQSNILVAELSGGKIVGWIGMYVSRSLTSDARVEISGLVVDESCRARKIGSALLKSAEDWARTQGCKTIGLHCNVVRERAHRFYERHGYTAHKQQTV